MCFLIEFNSPLQFLFSKSWLLCNFVVYVWCFTLCGSVPISTTEANGHTSLLSIGNTCLKLALGFVSGAIMCLSCNR